MLALSPAMLLVFTSDIFPGSISDEKMVTNVGFCSMHRMVLGGRQTKVFLFNIFLINME